jgi:hypothetical protein
MRAIALKLLPLCVLISSCCAGAAAPTSLKLKGEAPSALSGTGAADSAVTSALTALLEERVYDSGAYMSWGCSGGHDASKIVTGPVDSHQPDSEVVSGTGTRQSGRYKMEFNLPEGHLTLDSDFNATQGLIYEIKQQGSPVISSRTVSAECSFSGELAGQQVELTFQQDLHAVKDNDYSGGF